MITAKLLISKQWYKKPFGIGKSEFAPVIHVSFSKNADKESFTQ